MMTEEVWRELVVPSAARANAGFGKLSEFAFVSGGGLLVGPLDIREFASAARFYFDRDGKAVATSTLTTPMTTRDPYRLREGMAYWVRLDYILKGEEEPFVGIVRGLKAGSAIAQHGIMVWPQVYSIGDHGLAVIVHAGRRAEIPNFYPFIMLDEGDVDEGNDEYYLDGRGVEADEGNDDGGETDDVDDKTEEIDLDGAIGDDTSAGGGERDNMVARTSGSKRNNGPNSKKGKSNSRAHNK